jgi:Stress responsive A/B Barrel Domain
MTSQIEHIVLFKPREEATEEQKRALREGLLSLQDKIPGILSMTCGFNFSERAAGYEIGFVVRFQDRAALEAYLPHPEHRAAVEEFVRPVSESVIVVDYEVGAAE